MWVEAFDAFAGSDSELSLQRFICVLILFHQGSSMEDRLRLCFQCFDTRQCGYIAKADIEALFAWSYALFCPEISDEDISLLAQRIVRNLGFESESALYADWQGLCSVLHSSELIVVVPA